MKPVTRLETLVQAIIEGSDLPFSAVDRIEMFLSDIISGQVSSIAPVTRLETYLAKISGQDIDIPTPITRIECFLAAIAGRNVNLPTPITRLEMLLNVWADSAASHTLSGPIVSFLGKSNTEILSLTAALHPIQDLHGYDRPWAAGAGTNKAYWPTLSKTSSNGVDYSITDDGNALVICGTATSASNGAYSVPSYNNLPFGPFPAGVYTIKAVGFVGQNVSDRININAKYSDGSNVSIANVRISGPSGTIPDGTGRTLTFTATDEFKFGFYIYVASGTAIDCSVKVQFVEGDKLGEWTPYANVCPVSGWTGASIYVSPTQNQSDSTTYSADWTSEAGTVYAGSYEAVSGKLKSHPQYSSYNGETLVGPWLSSMDVYAAGTTPTTGAQVVDLGGAETEYTLTPQEVTALVGKNYVWSDAGDVSVTVKNIVPQ